MHSDLSSGTTNIDSVTKPEMYIDRAKECGMKAFAFSEHGNIYKWVKKKELIEKAGMKYIHGIEAYITESLVEKVRDNYHCVLLAKNYDGVKEINRLSSMSYNKQDGHRYYMPRITMGELENTSSNVIVSTACLGGILHKGNDIIRERFISFLNRNKDRCFLEIQHHNVKDQIEYNQYLNMLSHEIDVPLIAGTDTHALNELHMQGRSMLQKGKGVYFSDEESWDLSFKTYDELVSAYMKQDSLPMEIVLEAIENTNRMADMVEPFELDRSYKYPHLWENPTDTFNTKIQDGIVRRGVDKYPNYQEYLDRIEYEMKAYVHNEAIDFMLLMADIIEWCVDNDIRVGYGRGSVNGSVIAWLIGITEMDSIKHGLNFDRFMNVERVSLSDIDTDFPPSRIDDVKQYIFSKHGLYCSDIVTFNTIADRGAIRDIGRALAIPLDVVTNICNSVDNEDEYAKNRKKYTELFKYVDIVKGVVVSVGSHPCGLVVSPHTIDDSFGTFMTATSEYPISQIYMKEIDGLNYVKLDLLKLDTIEIINDTCKLANIERLTPDNVDITDLKVWNAIRDDTTQIFQWEGITGDSYIKKLLSDDNIKKFQAINSSVDRMTLLSIGNSAIRPAGASYRDDLANGVIRTSGSTAIDKFLNNTFGYLVFQEQIIAFLHQYCGFTMGEADIVRRHFAKKTGTESDIPIIKYGGYFDNDTSGHHIKGFVATMQAEYGQSKVEAEQSIVAFVQVIMDASDYLFSLNHSQPYSYEGYVSGWLRTYYPLEFLTVAMNVNSGNEEKTKTLIAYAKKVGIAIKSPRFRHSRGGYFCDKKQNIIYRGIGSVKYMNTQIADELYNMRDGKYNDFVDVLYEVKEKTTLDARQLDILVKIDFFCEFGDINKLLYCIKMFSVLYGKSQMRKDKVADLAISEDVIRAYSEEETETRVEEINCGLFMKSLGFSEQEIREELRDCVKYKFVRDEALGKNIRVPNGFSSKKVFKKYSMTQEQKKAFATKTVIGKFSGIKSKDLLKHMTNNNTEKCTLVERIGYQLEHLGSIEYTDDKMDVRYIVVTSLDTKYSPKFKAYCIKTGQLCEMKIHKKPNNRDKKIKTWFTKLPIKDGDILYMEKCDREPKRKKTDDGWGVVPGVFEWWLNGYRKAVL